MTPAQVIAVADRHAPLGQLRETLEQYGIRYCQWKGHSGLDRWMRGEGDLDLLVARTDAGRLTSALAEIGFKPVVLPPEKQIPGTESYYGLGPGNREFAHIHVHYHLRLGHYRTMNYHLPLEPAVLASSIPTTALRVPAPELEFIVFVVRMVLADSFTSALRRRRDVSSPRRALEWQYFASRVTQSRVRELLHEQFPGLSEALFNRCVRSLSPGCPIWTRLRVKGQLRHLLRSRRSRLADVLVRWRDASAERMRRALGGRARHKRPATGGMIIALLGGDGAGKTTAVHELVRWLSPTFDTDAVHLGKPPRSAATLSIALVRRLLALVGIRPNALMQLRSVSIARDRWRMYARACRRAAAGAIVICDRYPTSFIQHMDGPNIHVDDTSGRLAQLLHRRERAYYDRILAPDLSIVLRVEPRTAMLRKQDEDPEYVHSRSQQVWNLDLRGSSAHVVDADRPIADVLGDLRSLVWARL